MDGAHSSWKPKVCNVTEVGILGETAYIKVRVAFRGRLSRHIYRADLRDQFAVILGTACQFEGDRSHLRIESARNGRDQINDNSIQ